MITPARYPRLPVEDVDRLLGRRFRFVAGAAAGVEVLVSAFDGTGRVVLHCRNAAPRRQELPAITFAAAIDAGIAVEL